MDIYITGILICIEYLGSTASYLFGGNVTNFLLSMEDKDKNWVVNLNDPAVRSVCVAMNGEALPPYVPPAAPAAAATDKDKKKEVCGEFRGSSFVAFF